MTCNLRQTGWLALSAAIVTLLAGPTPAAAQATGNIEGAATASAGQTPLFGVRVQIVGTANVQTTGQDGRFSFRNVPVGTHTVRASLIGYARVETTVEVTDGQTATANFTLSRAAITLEDVVVTGTPGAQEKVALGNTVGQIREGQLEPRPLNNVMEALTATIPGLTLISNSGQVGSSTNIRIRGAGSLNGGYQPVFYVDGVRIEAGVIEGGSTYQGGTALDFLNPEDIESIEVIKGPAAATLYGAEAAEGVIQIITKKGRRGSEGVQWTASMEVGENEWTPSIGSNKTYWRCTVDMQDSLAGNPLVPVFPGCYDPTTVQWWGKDSDGNARLYTGIPTSDIIALSDGSFLLKDDPLFRHPRALRVGGATDFNLSARGGAGSFGYFLSFNRNYEDGVFFNNFSRRIGGRANFDVQVARTLDVALQFDYTRTHLQQPLNNNASNSINRNAMRGKARATRDPWEAGFLGFSPFLSNEFDNQNRVERMTIGFTSNWVPLEWFRHRLTLGLDRQGYTETGFQRQDTTGRAPWGTTAATGTIDHELQTIHRWTVDYSGSVERDLSDELSSVSSAGLQLNARKRRGYFAIGQGLVANNLNLVGLASTRTSDEEVSEQTSLGVYLQEQVGWRQRLFVTGAVRIDDNSAFGSEFSLVTYPKASVSWLISEENFFQNLNWGFLDQVKVRFAWGKAGNAPAPFSADRTYSGGQGVTGDALNNVVGISEYGNPDLRAETGVEWETGFDASVLSGRAGVEFTYYNQHTVDALVSIPDPRSTGWTDDHLINIGEISNEGVELLLTGTPVSRPNFTWDATLSLSGNRNRLVSFNGVRDQIVFGAFADVQRHREGYPLGAFWATDVERDASGEPVIRDNAGNIVANPVNDVSVNHATVLSSCRWAPSDPTWTRAECQDVYMGPSTPTREASFTNTFTLFKNVRIFTQLDYRGDFYQWCAICSINSRIDLNTWDVNTGGTTLNPDVSIADVLAIKSLQTKSHITRADFVKLREVSVSFTLPERWTRPLPVGDKWTLQVSGRNLAIWTKYKGRGDPEVNFDPTSSFQMLDYASTPPTRRLTASLRVTF